MKENQKEAIQPVRRFTPSQSLPLLCALCASAVNILPASAGELNPPPGPVFPTPGPEPRTAVNAANTPGDADSLFRITQPGSYYLEANIAGVAGRHGVEIAASGVTLDLNGFDLVGVPGSLDGVNVSLLNSVNVNVRNGSLRSWGGSGVNLTDAATSGTNLADLVATQNGSAGIRMGFGGTITRCTAYNNTGIGFAGAAGTVITECAANSNGSHGITTGSGCTISRCSARSNAGDGINVFGSCLILNNACSNNGAGAATGAGIHALTNDNRIEGNVCTGGDLGIVVDAAGNFITRNICSGATTNWNLAAGNICLVVNAAAAGAFAGNSGGVAPGSTDPNANFTY
jgi:parallel beta-helix repeat protein